MREKLQSIVANITNRFPASQALLVKVHQQLLAILTDHNSLLNAPEYTPRIVALSEKSPIPRSIQLSVHQESFIVLAPDGSPKGIVVRKLTNGKYEILDQLYGELFRKKVHVPFTMLPGMLLRFSEQQEGAKTADITFSI